MTSDKKGRKKVAIKNKFLEKQKAKSKMAHLSYQINTVKSNNVNYRKLQLKLIFYGYFCPRFLKNKKVGQKKLSPT